MVVWDFWTINSTIDDDGWYEWLLGSQSVDWLAIRDNIVWISSEIFDWLLCYSPSTVYHQSKRQSHLSNSPLIVYMIYKWFINITICKWKWNCQVLLANGRTDLPYECLGTITQKPHTQLVKSMNDKIWHVVATQQLLSIMWVSKFFLLTTVSMANSDNWCTPNAEGDITFRPSGNWPDPGLSLPCRECQGICPSTGHLKMGPKIYPPKVFILEISHIFSNSPQVFAKHEPFDIIILKAKYTFIICIYIHIHMWSPTCINATSWLLPCFFPLTMLIWWWFL